MLDASEDTFRAVPPRIDQLFTYLYGLYYPSKFVLTSLDFQACHRRFICLRIVNLLEFLKGPVEYLEQRHILMTSRDEEYFKSQAEVLRQG